MARVLRGRRRARALLRRARRALEVAAARARAPARALPRPRGRAARAPRRARPRSLRRRLRGSARRGTLSRHEPRADVHLGDLLGRPRAGHDPAGERLGVAQPVARRGRLRRVVLATGPARMGGAVRLPGAPRSLACCVPSVLLRRDGARVHGPLRPADARAGGRDLQLDHLGRNGGLRSRRLAAKRRGVRRLLRPALPAVDPGTP